MPKLTKAKRLLIDHLILAFAHYQDGEHEEAAKVLQQASEISDVTDVVDEINEDQKEALKQEDQGGEHAVDPADPAGASGGVSGDEVIPSDEDLESMDDTNVQARLDVTAKKLREARASSDIEAVRKCSRAIYKLHARARQLKKLAAEASTKPVDRAARAFANAAKLKAAKK